MCYSISCVKKKKKKKSSIGFETTKLIWSLGKIIIKHYTSLLMEVTWAKVN